MKLNKLFLEKMEGVSLVVVLDMTMNFPKRSINGFGTEIEKKYDLSNCDFYLEESDFDEEGVFTALEKLNLPYSMGNDVTYEYEVKKSYLTITPQKYLDLASGV